MKYCSECGEKLSLLIAENDSQPRHTCTACGYVHYRNPNIIAGCIIEHNGKVLLCQRAIEPKIGAWTLPAGFMEIDESIEEAAVRETWEEANAKVEINSLYSVFHVAEMNQVYIIYRATLLNDDFSPGPESLQVKLFEPSEIPWDELFYPAINDILQRFKIDLQLGVSSVYSGSSVEGDVLVVDHTFKY